MVSPRAPPIQAGDSSWCLLHYDGGLLLGRLHYGIQVLPKVPQYQLGGPLVFPSVLHSFLPETLPSALRFHVFSELPGPAVSGVASPIVLGRLSLVPLSCESPPWAGMHSLISQSSPGSAGALQEPGLASPLSLTCFPPIPESTSWFSFWREGGYCCCL